MPAPMLVVLAVVASAMAALAAVLVSRRRKAVTVAGQRWFRDLRTRAELVLDAVNAASGLPGVTAFKGWDFPSYLDRDMACLLTMPDRELEVRLGIGVEYLGSVLGDRRALVHALESVGSEDAVRRLADRGFTVLPFSVRLRETDVGLISVKGIVVPLGRTDDVPVAAVVGVGCRGASRVRLGSRKLFVFGGVVDARRVFSEVLGAFEHTEVSDEAVEDVDEDDRDGPTVLAVVTPVGGGTAPGSPWRPTRTRVRPG
ncbi:hypothetical protein [Methanopyrus sp.]